MAETTFTRQQILHMQESCVCSLARNKARLLTKAYDQMLAPSGLKITQFNLLAVLLAGSATIGELASAVKIDRTTLSRGLVPLQRDGYITLTAGQDVRKHIVTLTAKGVRCTKEALELWKQAQALYVAQGTREFV